jgi:hypothetical protein
VNGGRRPCRLYGNEAPGSFSLRQRTERLAGRFGATVEM